MQGVSTKIVSGGVPPGMEGLWAEYRKHHYDTQRLFRDQHWKEHGVDHAIIGHMWRLVARHKGGPTLLVLASGDGQKNEFGTSFLEVLDEILSHSEYGSLRVRLACFDWDFPKDAYVRPPTNTRMRQLVQNSPRGEFVNLMDHYDKLVYHEAEEIAP